MNLVNFQLCKNDPGEPELKYALLKLVCSLAELLRVLGEINRNMQAQMYKVERISLAIVREFLPDKHTAADIQRKFETLTLIY
jgi:hypothetical protein